MKKKSIGIIAVSVLCAFAIFAGAMFAHQYFDAKNSEDSFDELTDLIVDVPDETVPETDNSEATELLPEELAAQEAEQARAKYKELFEQNDDFIGWIAIDATNVNYPVMQTPDNPDYYLKHSFEKTYSDYGVPYMYQHNDPVGCLLFSIFKH